MMTLENEVLAVDLYDQPVVRAYEHKPTGARIAGAGTLGVLAVNGRPIPWDDWEIETRVEQHRPAVTYTLYLATMRLDLAFRFALQESSLVITLERLEEQGIDCATPGRVTTTFSQALELIHAIHHITDGMPLIFYLVGWQYDGHDTGYPSLDRVNPALGGPEGLRQLVATAKERYTCTVSYHINLDDSYKEHPVWDESVICGDVDGSLLSWEPFNGRMSYHISHTKDVESGKVGLVW